MSKPFDGILGILAAFGIGASGGAVATQALQPSPAPVAQHCAAGWRETTERVPAAMLPGATFSGTRITTTCVGPDGKTITLDGAGNVANATDEKGAPLQAPKSYLP